jgi:hypothetical protein
MLGDCLVKCPKCNEEVEQPCKSLKNNAFHIEAYTCKNCQNNFKVTTELIFLYEKRSAH